MTDQRRPIHLAVLVGLSASAYAGSLGAVSVLQSAADSSLIAQRAPVRAAADAVAASHSDLEATVAEAVRRYGLVSERYAALVPEFSNVETSLDALAKNTAKVSNSAQALPSRVSLPKVSAPRIVRVAAPATHATTGASGG
jgi:hypothetical protein